MRYLLETTRGYRLRFSCLFFTIIFATVTGGMFPYAIGKIVDQIFYQKQLRGFLGCFFLYAGFYFLNQCGHMALNYLWAHLKVSYVTDIRKQCFEHLLRLKAGILAQVRSGDVMKRIQDDTECFLEFIHRSLFYVLANFVQLGISVGYTIYTNFFLGLTVIVMTPVMAYSIRYFSRKLTERHERIRDKMGLADAWIQEVMVGLTEIRLLGALPKAGEDYEGKTRDVIREEIGAGYLGLEADSVNEMLTLAGQLCIYCIAAFSVCRGTMTVGQFVACAAYFSSCAAYFNALGRKLTDISANMVGIRRVEEFLSWEVEQDSLSAKERCIREGGISFADVSFGYAEAMVLKQISLEVHPGDRVAFVGKSGEGKSTLLQLIYRFYEPQEGKILIDGAELADYTLESLRNQIGVVQQDNGLFRGSLRENIALSDDKSQDARIWQILEGLKLKELAESFEDGLDTVVGSGARSLSGGQKQRIAIARCIFRNPRILLLDEATSALDEVTECEVNAFLYSRLPHTTILSAAHRFSTILAAEKIAVIEHGRISDIGTHRELMEKNVLYRTLFEEYQQSLREGGTAK